jgi:alkanesulfonate monooxygenase SsuD/methylene tetrahydromethanopterin reductase-like flavin-dependent oxidoreductase (luciferase family)
VRGAHVLLDAVQLDFPPSPPPPLLIGTTGPRGLAIAARAADGIVLPEGSGTAAVRWARAEAGDGATTVYAWLALGDDAVGALRPHVEHWVRRGNYPVLAELAGIDQSAAVRDEAVRAVTVSGDAAACADAIAALHAAGADSVVLLPVAGDRDEQLARVAADVLPRLH